MRAPGSHGGLSTVARPVESVGEAPTVWISIGRGPMSQGAPGAFCPIFFQRSCPVGQAFDLWQSPTLRPRYFSHSQKDIRETVCS